MTMHKLRILSGLVLSATCMVLHRPQIPVILGLQYQDNPNYNFPYEVNDAHTGDIKSQQESRRGDTGLGQYSLLQPDGVQRTVNYRADNHAGYIASVNNDGRAINQYADGQLNDVNREENVHPSFEAQVYQQWPAPAISSATSIPVAVSRTSVVQTVSHGNNPWI